jgi:aminomethyltransferase
MLARTELVALADAYPYTPTVNRLKLGLRRTAFHQVIGARAKQFKLHNGFLKPDIVTDPIEEYWAMRRAAGLWDVTGEEPIEVSGKEALSVLNELVPRDLARLRDGRCLYSVMCYDYGGILEDGVIVRFGPERLWWVGGPAPAEQWIYAHALGREAGVRSRLNEVHVCSVQGPRSRDILQRVCESDLSRLPYYGVIETKVCAVPVVVSRTGYTAELGFDIYVDVGRGAALFGELWEAGKPCGLALCGSRALAIRRTEAGILDIGAEFDWTTNPYEVGLGWMVDLGKPRFRGRDALAAVRERGVERRLVGLRLGSERVPLHADRVSAGGRPVGAVTSAVRSPALDGVIAMAMVAVGAAEEGTEIEVESAGERLGGVVVRLPFLDPERRLARA